MGRQLSRGTLELGGDTTGRGDLGEVGLVGIGWHADAPSAAALPQHRPGRFLLTGVCIAAVGCVLIFGSGCGGDAPSGSISGERKSGGQAGIGDTVSLSTVRTEVEVTLEGVDQTVKIGEFDEPSQPDGRFVAVELGIENVGEEPFGGSLIPAVGLITDQDFEAKYATPGESQCPLDFALDTQIAPGDRRAGCVIFELPKSQEPRTFQFSVDSGGSNPNTAEWSIG